MRLKHLQTNRQFMIGNSIVFIGVIFVVVLFLYLSLRMQAQKSGHHYYNEVYNIGLVQGFAGEDFTVYMNDSIVFDGTISQEPLRIEVKRFAEECPKIRPIVPEASFLVFLDCKALGFKTQGELEHFFAFDAKIGMNSGAMFGKGGVGFMRLNVGCPRSVVNEAIDRIVRALS